jgi:hypothetical protein
MYSRSPEIPNESNFCPEIGFGVNLILVRIVEPILECGIWIGKLESPNPYTISAYLDCTDILLKNPTMGKFMTMRKNAADPESQSIDPID